MISMDKIIQDKLMNDEELKAYHGGRVFRNVVPLGKDNKPQPLPVMRIVELNNIDYEYLDNESVSSFITVQVDLWTKDSPDRLLPIIHRVMRSLEMKRESVATVFEEDTKEIRKIFRYSAIKNNT